MKSVNLLDDMTDLCNDEFQGFTYEDEYEQDIYEQDDFEETNIDEEPEDNSSLNNKSQITHLTLNLCKKGNIIKKKIEQELDFVCLRFGRHSKGVTSKEITNVLSEFNNTSIIDLADSLVTSFEDKDYFLSQMKFKRKSTGSVLIDKYQVEIYYTINTKGIVTFTAFANYYDYECDIEEAIRIGNEVSYTDSCKELARALSQAYPVITNPSMPLDLIRIIVKGGYKYGIAQLKRTIRQLAKLKTCFKLVNTRLCAGHIKNLQQIVWIDSSKFPILDFTGTRVIDYIDTREGILNSTPTEKEKEYGFQMYRRPTVTENLFTFLDGSFGFICNGNIIKAVRNRYYTDAKPIFDIYLETNNKSDIRFKEYYKLNCKDENFKSNFTDEMEMFNHKLLKENVIVETERELVNTLRELTISEKIRYTPKSGSFNMGKCDLELKGTMYDDDTLWEEITTPEIYKNETPEQREKRIYHAMGILDRISIRMYVPNMFTTSDALKYANSAVNSSLDMVKNEQAPVLTKEDLDKLPVKTVVNTDMLLAVTKYEQSFKNKCINMENKSFIKNTLKRWYHGYYTGNEFNIEEMLNKDLFIQRYSNSLLDMFLRNKKDAELYMNKVKEIKKIKDIEDKCEAMREELNIDVDKDFFEDEYFKYKTEYDILIKQIEEFENANLLSIRYKIKLHKTAMKYNKATNKNLKIQNFKVEIINLSNEVIEENEYLMEELNTKNEEEKELKKTLKQTNTNLRKLNRVLKKDNIKTTTYNNYKTDKTEIDIDDLCNTIKNQITEILNSKNLLLQFRYNIDNLISLGHYIDDILADKYEIPIREVYSKPAFMLNNQCCNIA